MKTGIVKYTYNSATTSIEEIGIIVASFEDMPRVKSVNVLGFDKEPMYDRSITLAVKVEKFGK